VSSKPSAVSVAVAICDSEKLRLNVAHHAANAIATGTIGPRTSHETTKSSDFIRRPCYSVRSASIGFTRVARRAGT
jgi:hypothetical protein